VKGEDLAAATLGGAQVADGSLTGADIDEGSLGKVPSAATVDTVQSFHLTPALNQPAVVMTRGPFTLKAACVGAVGTAEARLTLSTSTDNSVWSASTGGGDGDFDVSDGDATVLSDGSGPGIIVEDFSAFGASGTSLVGFASLAGLISTCRIDLGVVG